VTYKLLIVEDDVGVADLIALAVQMNWPNCKVVRATNGTEALGLFKAEQPDLVLLDINIPPPDGFQVCLAIRESSQVPILMLTARTATLDKIRALDLGADDYLTKPFDHLELMARLRAIARRSNKWSAEDESRRQVAYDDVTEVAARAGPKPPGITPLAAQELLAGDIRINLLRREVYLSGQLLPLTTTEYRLLEELVRHAGSVLPHSYLLERVWGPNYDGEYHYLKVFVRRLRSKLGDQASHPRYIQTEWGVGYRFVPSSE
jgi:two-component system KDP operon response regulator KdpE